MHRHEQSSSEGDADAVVEEGEKQVQLDAVDHLPANASVTGCVRAVHYNCSTIGVDTDLDRSTAVRTSDRFDRTSTMSATSIATSVPAPMAMPTLACGQRKRTVRNGVVAVAEVTDSGVERNARRARPQQQEGGNE